MTLLTPGEYDDLPQEAKDALAGVVRHPRNDTKSRAFRHQFGKYRNGDLDADLTVMQQIGYGTGSPLAPHDTSGS